MIKVWIIYYIIDVQTQIVNKNITNIKVINYLLNKFSKWFSNKIKLKTVAKENN